MPIQYHQFIAPRGGIRTDLPADLIDDTEMPAAQNVFFDDGLIKKRFGYVKKGTTTLPLTGPVTGADIFYLFVGTNHCLAITTTDIYKWVPTITSKDASDTTITGSWVLITPGVVLDACDSAWTGHTNVTSALDTTDRVEGTGSCKLTLTAAKADENLLAYNAISNTNISSNTYIGFWLKSSINLAAEALEIVVSESNHAAGEKTGTYVACLSTALTAGTWTFVRLAKTLTDFDAVISVSIYANATIANGTVLHIDDVRSYVPLAATYSSSASDMASFAHVRGLNQTEPWWIMSNGTDELMKWTGSNLATQLISSFPTDVNSLTAKTICEFKNYLMLFDVKENSNRYPQRVRWSDTGDPIDFLGGNANYVDLPGSDWIVGAIKFRGDYIVVLKEQSIWLGYATGDTDIFKFDMKIAGVGCAAGKTMAAIDEYLIFLGWDDVYVFDGISARPAGVVGTENISPIRQTLINEINPNQVEKCFGAVLEEKKEYWLFIPSKNGTYPDVAWVFNYGLGKWSRHTFSDYITACGYYSAQSSRTIDELTGTINAQDWRFDDRITYQLSPSTLFGDQSGYIYELDYLAHDDNGTAVDGWFQTKDFNLTNLVTEQRVIGLIHSWIGSGLTVSYSTDRGLTWTDLDALTFKNDFSMQNLDFRSSNQTIRFRMRNNSIGGWFHWNRGILAWLSGGRLNA